MYQFYKDLTNEAYIKLTIVDVHHREFQKCSYQWCHQPQIRRFHIQSLFIIWNELTHKHPSILFSPHTRTNDAKYYLSTADCIFNWSMQVCDSEPFQFVQQTRILLYRSKFQTRSFLLDYVSNLHFISKFIHNYHINTGSKRRFSNHLSLCIDEIHSKILSFNFNSIHPGSAPNYCSKIAFVPIV